MLDPSSGIDLRNLDSYLVSEKFSVSTVYEEVRNRCFASLTGNLLTAAQRVLLNTDSSGDRTALEKQGVWNRDVGFISPLVDGLVFLEMKTLPATDAIILDESDAAVPAAEQVTCAGLRDMPSASFMDAHYDMVAVENAVAGYGIPGIPGIPGIAPKGISGIHGSRYTHIRLSLTGCRYSEDALPLPITWSTDTE